jgi:hypothetical protein
VKEVGRGECVEIISAQRHLETKLRPSNVRTGGEAQLTFSKSSELTTCIPAQHSDVRRASNSILTESSSFDEGLLLHVLDLRVPTSALEKSVGALAIACHNVVRSLQRSIRKQASSFFRVRINVTLYGKSASFFQGTSTQKIRTQQVRLEFDLGVQTSIVHGSGGGTLRVEV